MMKRFKFWRRLLVLFFLLPVVVFVLATAIVYFNQDSIAARLISDLNMSFAGEIEIADQHISPFENFPFISIDLNHVALYEKKQQRVNPVLRLDHVYIGFNFWTVLGGKTEIKSIVLKGGVIDLIQDTSGVLNINKAIASKEKTNEKSGIKINLKKITVLDIDISKVNQRNNIKVDVYMNSLNASFRTSPEHLAIGCESNFIINILKGKDTTFFKHKHIQLSSRLDYDKTNQLLNVEPSNVKMENANFNMAGKINIRQDMDLDLRFSGRKSNFDLLLAFAPEELLPVLNKFENNGNVYFTAVINGKSINGFQPHVKVFFGCRDAMFLNRETKRKLDKLNFRIYFTNGINRNASTMEFSLTDLSARMENGEFNARARVRNFRYPEIELETSADFQLNYIASFFNLRKIKELTGRVKFFTKFNDVIDIKNPTKTLERLSDGYVASLEIEHLNLKEGLMRFPVRDLNLIFKCTGSSAEITNCSGKLGKSDFAVMASVDDFPAIIHHQDKKVSVAMNIRSGLIDLAELTLDSSKKNSTIDEKIFGTMLSMKFSGSAKSFSGSAVVPTGEFRINSFSARLDKYPHSLHDIGMNIKIDKKNIEISDLKCAIDKSDLEMTCFIDNYPALFDDKPGGEIKTQFRIKSRLLQFQDVFTYRSINYMPEDYRHEECRQLFAAGNADINFKNGRPSFVLTLDQLHVGLKMHPLHLDVRNLKAKYSDYHLTLDNMVLKAGHTFLNARLNYNMGIDSLQSKKENYLFLQASNIDMDELFNYQKNPVTVAATSADHEKSFNIYDLSFPNMSFDLSIENLKYHRYLISNFKGKMQTLSNHHIKVDNVEFCAAGGQIQMKGEFDGSNSKKIFLDPDLNMSNVSIDKLLFKFENFGQDHLASENVHGRLSGKINGHIRIHPDFVPVLEESVINLDLKLTEGRLENYAPMSALSSYFKDKNLNRVLFDTLVNRLSLNKGVLNVPSMTINTTLGFIDISGKQSVDMDMEYYLKIPVKIVTKAGWQKLFGRSANNPAGEDEIQYKANHKNAKYLNLKIKGKGSDFKVTFGRDKTN